MLIASHCHSLKEKRQVVQTLKGRVRSRFDLVLREVGGQDTWQRLELGFAVVAGTEGYVTDTVADVVAYLDEAGLARLVGDHRDVVSLEAPEVVDYSADDWVPEEWATQNEGGES